MTSQFTVPGVPVPKGSAKAFVVKGRARVTQTNAAKQKPWASMIAYTAQQHGVRVATGSVLLRVKFWMPRPKNHYRANGELKPWALTAEHTKKPDLDKLVRCVKDALTGVAWGDDSQVTALFAEKEYACSGPGARIEITTANPDGGE